jgi:hypothetical protein
VLGYEDGSVHVYDYSRFKGENYKKLVFSVSKEDMGSAEERFCETSHNQSGTIVSI